MRLLTTVLLFWVLWSLNSCTGPEQSNREEFTTVVFAAGEEEFSYFRIPALLTDQNDLYAFAEGRKNSLSDHGEISIVVKASHDYGKTWDPMSIVVESNGESAQNPTPVLIPSEQKLILLFTKRTVGSDTEHMIRSGNSEGYMGVYITESMDRGHSWSAPKEITKDVKLSNWNWYALGPGGAIILENQLYHPGRIIIPANHSVHGGSGNEFLGAHVIYSDDNGRNWKLGAIDSKGTASVNPNETAVVELTDGRLYFNTRNHNPDDTLAHRAITYSMDGGETFTSGFYHDPQLISPIVHASLARSAEKIFFVAPFDLNHRINMSLWTSDDETSTWQYKKLLVEGPSAYSSSSYLFNNCLGILMETNEYASIEFKSLPVN